MTERKIFSLDRIEGEWAVCVSDDGDVMDVPAALLAGLSVRDVFSAISDGESLIDITPMPEERDRRIADAKARLHALARRSKK